MFDLVTLLKYN